MHVGAIRTHARLCSAFKARPEDRSPLKNPELALRPNILKAACLLRLSTALWLTERSINLAGSNVGCASSSLAKVVVRDPPSASHPKKAVSRSDTFSLIRETRTNGFRRLISVDAKSSTIFERVSPLLSQAKAVQVRARPFERIIDLGP